MDLGEVIEEVEDHLDARQVDAQVALKAHNRPEAADLRRLVTDLRALVNGSDQSQALVADEQTGGDREFLCDLVAWDDRSNHGRYTLAGNTTTARHAGGRGCA